MSDASIEEKLGHISGQLEQIGPRLDRIQSSAEDAREAAASAAGEMRQALRVAMGEINEKFKMFVTKDEFVARVGPLEKAVYAIIGATGLALLMFAINHFLPVASAVAKSGTP